MSDSNEKMVVRSPSPSPLPTPKGHHSTAPTTPAVLAPEAGATNGAQQAAAPNSPQATPIASKVTAFVDMIVTPVHTQPTSNGHTTARATSASTSEGSGSTHPIDQPTHEEVAFLEEIAALRDFDFNLLSDLSILRGEFAKTSKEKKPKSEENNFIKIFEEAGFGDFAKQFDIEAALKTLENWVKKFQAARRNDRLKEHQIEDEEEKTHFIVLRELKKSFEGKRQKLTELRIKLENLATKPHETYYKYNLADIKYQVIGNQELPASAQKSRRRKSESKKKSPSKRKNDDYDGDDYSRSPAKKGKKNNGLSLPRTEGISLRDTFSTILNKDKERSESPSSNSSSSISARDVNAPLPPTGRDSRAPNPYGDKPSRNPYEDYNNAGPARSSRDRHRAPAASHSNRPQRSVSPSHGRTARPLPRGPPSPYQRPARLYEESYERSTSDRYERGPERSARDRFSDSYERGYRASGFEDEEREARRHHKRSRPSETHAEKKDGEKKGRKDSEDEEKVEAKDGIDNVEEKYKALKQQMADLEMQLLAEKGKL